MLSIVSAVAQQPLDPKKSYYDDLESCKEAVERFDIAQIDSAIWYGNKAIDLATELEDSTEMGSAINKLGLLYKRKKNYPLALEHLYKALTIREQQGDSARIASSYENVAQVQKNMGDTTAALENFRSSLAIKSKLGIPKYLASVYSGMGSLFRKMNRLDSAAHYYDLAIDIYEELQDTLRMAKLRNNVSGILFEDSLYQEAFDGYKEAIKLYQSINSEVGESQSRFNMAECYESLDQDEEALEQYLKSIELFLKTGYHEYLDWAYESLARLHEKMGNAEEALKNYYIYMNLRDSLANIDIEERIQELHIQYETEKKDQALALEVENSARLHAEGQNQLLTIYLLIAGLLGLAIIFWLIFRSQAQRKKIDQQELEIKNQEIDKLLERQEIKSYSAMLEGQDAERKRLAEDLHDRLGSILSTVKLHLQSGQPQGEQVVEGSPIPKKANELLDEAVSEVRKIAHNISTGVLSKYGLKAALEGLMETVSSTDKIKVELHLNTLKERYNSEVEIQIYRVIQELVSNVLKHAEASEIILQISDNKQSLDIVFEDNGIGFDSSKVGGGIGFQNITSRLQKVGGKHDLDTFVGRGTSVVIEVPLGR